MSPQEQQVLDAFLQRLAAVHGVVKDPQADALIREGLARQPDAAYLLVQRTLLLERALDEARARIDRLEQEASSRGDPGGAGFLGGGLEPGFGRAPTVPGPYGPGAQPLASAAPAPYAPAGYPPASYGAPQAPQAAPGWRERIFGGGSPATPRAVPAGGMGGAGFLGTAASAAAGVAGGMFLYNGIEHLMQDRHGGDARSAAADGAGSGQQANSLVGDSLGPRDTGPDGAGGFDGGGDSRQAALDDGGGWLSDGDAGRDGFGGGDDMLA